MTERDRLRTWQDDVWTPAFQQLKLLGNFQRGLKLAIIAATIIGAIGGGLNGDMLSSEGNVTTKGLMIGIGAVVAGFAAVLLLLGEQDGATLLDSANALAREAGTFIEERDRLTERYTNLGLAAEALDTRRRERLAAMERMLEVVEAALLNRADAGRTAPNMLRQGIHAVRKAVDYRGTDFLTVSIFRCEDRGDGAQLYRIAAEWSDPARADRPGRSWKSGQGYTGVAWSRAADNPGAEVIEPDTSLMHIETEYPVPDRDPTREALYLSVAAIPILVGADDEVWGVVTATVDRRDFFQRHGQPGFQNVEVIRDIARFAGLLAGLDRFPARTATSQPRASWFGGAGRKV